MRIDRGETGAAAQRTKIAMLMHKTARCQHTTNGVYLRANTLAEGPSNDILSSRRFARTRN